MAKITYYWHIHHDILCEGTTDIEERIAYIKNNKLSNEIPLRLKLMQKVKNPSKLPREWKEAFQKWEEAYQKWGEVYQKWRVADQKRNEADQKWEEAYQKWMEAVQKWKEADQKWKEADQKRDEVYRQHKPQLEALHKIEHPNCPWDGKSIFG